MLPVFAGSDQPVVSVLRLNTCCHVFNTMPANALTS